MPLGNVIFGAYLQIYHTTFIYHICTFIKCNVKTDFQTFSVPRMLKKKSI